MLMQLHSKFTFVWGLLGLSIHREKKKCCFGTPLHNIITIPYGKWYWVLVSCWCLKYVCMMISKSDGETCKQMPDNTCQTQHQTVVPKNKWSMNFSVQKSFYPKPRLFCIKKIFMNRKKIVSQQKKSWMIESTK